MMTLKEIETRLRTVDAGEYADPALADATTRRDGLARHVATLTEQLAAQRAALAELEVAAERTLLAGKTVDDRPFATIRTEITGLQSRLEMHTRALTAAASRVTELEQGAAMHAEATLTPLAVDLLTRLDQAIEGVAAIEAALMLMHHVAASKCPRSSSLTQGYCVFAPEITRAWWRARVEASGLCSTRNPQRVVA